MIRGSNGILGPIQIGIIGKNDHTVSELVHYLTHVGTQARRLMELRTLCEVASEREGLHAIVIFPDDFEGDVIKILSDLSDNDPTLLQLIITREPLRFAPPPGSQLTVVNRCVLPRPAFCWLILDVIRDHLLSLDRSCWD